MSKLQVFDGKQTTWAGLWWHPETSCFTSETINLSKLREFKGNVRMYVRKNKFYNGGENGRPNYCFCLRDTKFEKEEPWEVEDMDEAAIDQLYTREEVLEIANGVKEYVLNDISNRYGVDLDDYWCNIDLPDKKSGGR